LHIYIIIIYIILVPQHIKLNKNVKENLKLEKKNNHTVIQFLEKLQFDFNFISFCHFFFLCFSSLAAIKCGGTNESNAL